MTLATEFGQFNAIMFLFALCVSLLISKTIVTLAKYGAAEHEKKGVDKNMSYLSGYSEIDIKKIQRSNELQVAGQHILWGFKEALQSYYTPIKKEHTGYLIDYNIWLTIVLAVILLIIVLSGGV